MKIKTYILLLIVSLAFALPCLAHGAEVALSWDPSTDEDLYEYRVYYGTGSRDYGLPVSSGNKTTQTVSNLQGGTTYYFTVTAVDISGNESGFSSEIAILIALDGPSQEAPPTDIAWDAQKQTGDDNWKNSGVRRAVRLLVKADQIVKHGNSIQLGFQGRSSGEYIIQMVSIAEKDSSGETGDVVDETWTRVFFNGKSQTSWATDETIIPPGEEKLSDLLPFDLKTGSDYYVTFYIKTASVYLNPPSTYSELYTSSAGSAEIKDWSEVGFGTTVDYHAFSRIYAQEIIAVPDINSWKATTQTGDENWKSSGVIRSVRLLVEGSQIQKSGNAIRLGFQGRSSGDYTIQMVSIAQRDVNGEAGDVVDESWVQVFFDGKLKDSWATDETVITAGEEKLSDPLVYDLSSDIDYYVTFYIKTPSVYLNPPSTYRELYTASYDSAEVKDWSVIGYGQTRDYHAFSNIYVAESTQEPPVPDTELPVLTISSPTTLKLYETKSNTMNIAGTAIDNVAVTQVTWESDRGESGTAVGTTDWSVSSIALAEGSNWVAVHARDAAGNVGSQTIKFIYMPPDITKPTISLVSPTTGTSYQTDISSITLSGVASDNVEIKEILWNNDKGESGSASGTKSWSISDVTLSSGLTTFFVKVVDSAGNEEQLVLNVNYMPPDITKPMISLVSPITGTSYQTDISSITLSGVASDNVEIKEILWSNDKGESGSASGTKSWSISDVTLSSGLTTFSVKVVDSAGNEEQLAISVNYTPIVTLPESATAWYALKQTGDTSWKNSGVVRAVRLLVRGGEVDSSGNLIRLGFQGRVSGNYVIQMVSIAEKDPNGATGDVVDETWKPVLFDGLSESSWATAEISILAGEEKKSDPLSFKLISGTDYYVTFYIKTPSVYLNPDSTYRELYSGTAGFAQIKDWSGVSYGQTRDYHAFSKIYTEVSQEIDTEPVADISSWKAIDQTGDVNWKNSSVRRTVRLLVKGSNVQKTGSAIRLGFHGRSSGDYSIQMVSIAERDLSSETGDVLDETWTRILFDGQSTDSWSTDEIVIPAGDEKLSDTIPFNLKTETDYYVTFYIKSPSVYLNPPSDYRELYTGSSGSAEVKDWSISGYSITRDYHAFSQIYVTGQ